VDEDWVFSATAADYNLGGAQVVYNGTTDAAPATYLINPVYASVVVISLSATLCNNFGGYLTVYYGGKKAAATLSAPTNVSGS